MKLWLKILLCVFAINLLGGLGAFITVDQIDGWYKMLEKPRGVPPNWLFGPVWTTIYSLIGVSLALIWHLAASGKAKKAALTWFAIQMILNFAWTPLFFGAHQLGWALVVIIAMLLTILITLIQFRSLYRLAGRLLIPYSIWVGYATYLNAGYWLLNR